MEKATTSRTLYLGRCKPTSFMYGFDMLAEKTFVLQHPPDVGEIQTWGNETEYLNQLYDWGELWLALKELVRS